MTLPLSAPYVQPRQPADGDRLTAVCLPLPIGVIAELDILPFDIHVRHGDRSVLYAMRDSAPGDLLAHAGANLDLVVPIEQARPYRRQLVTCLAHAAGRTDRAVVERARRMVTLLGPLLGPLVGETDIDPGGLTAAGVALAVVVNAVGQDRDLAERILGRRAAAFAPRAYRSGHGYGPQLDRSIDAAIIAALIAPSVDAIPEVAALAAAARDVGRIRASARTRADLRHPLVAADLVAASGGSAVVVAAIAAHHERLDGSGYPIGLAGESIGPAGRAVGLADGFVAMTRGTVPSQGIPQAEAFRALRIVTRGRFDDRAVIALADVVGGAADGSFFASRRPTSN